MVNRSYLNCWDISPYCGEHSAEDDTLVRYQSLSQNNGVNTIMISKNVTFLRVPNNSEFHKQYCNNAIITVIPDSVHSNCWCVIDV